MADRPTRLCIVSRDGLRSGDFIAALRVSFCSEEHLDIIMDRRHHGSAGAPDVEVDRRHQRQVDLELEANGFAIVPMSADVTDEGTPLSQLPLETPIEHLFPAEDEHQEQLESISNFWRRRSDTLIPILGVLIGLTMAALVLSLAGQITGQNLVGLLLTEPPSSDPGQPAGQTNESFTGRKLFQTQPGSPTSPPPARPDGESSSSDVLASTKSESPRDVDRLTPRRPETSGPSEVTDPTFRGTGPTSRGTVSAPKDASRPPRVARSPADETGAPSKVEAEQGSSGGRTRLSATGRPSPKAPVPSQQVTSALSAESAPKATPEPSVGPNRAELVREPISRGWGDSYAVRLLDSAGQPLDVAGVLLIAHMADGSVETIAMGALPEPGTYRGTVPTGRSTPVDLRIRVSTGDKFVEIPVRP